MRKAKNVPLPLEKGKNSFILRLNKDMYRDDIVQKAISEDKDWIKEVSKSGNYRCLSLKTSDLEDALSWINYLIYLHKG